MGKFLGLVLLTFLFVSCATPPGPATKLEHANVLPLQLNDNFQIRKILRFFTDGDTQRVQTSSEPATYENARVNFGAVDGYDISHRYGNYYSFFWRTSETADVTVRLEYRQTALNNYVMAQERYYPAAHGSYESPFEVTGDDFLEYGRVTSWRVILIVDGKIVALRQSFLWK
jgi:hypothetical protein